MHVITHRVLLFKAFGFHTATTDDSDCISMIEPHMFFHHIITKLKHHTSIHFPFSVKKKIIYATNSTPKLTGPPLFPYHDQTLRK